MKKSFRSALLLLGFNRPEKMRFFLNALVPTQLKNRNLYVSVDGPRNDLDKALVQEVLRIIHEYAAQHRLPITVWAGKNNLGCKLSVSGAITKVLNQEETIIVLEDDCIPSASFIPFCDTLLVKYLNDTSIMHISGSNLKHEPVDIQESYYFSKYPLIWGWATWKRAWKDYDPHVTSWTDHKAEFMKRTHFPNTAKNWALKLQRASDGSLDSWAFQWLYTILMKQGACITPKFNMIKNIGFDQSATHSFVSFLKPPYSDLPCLESDQTMVHPQAISSNILLDTTYEQSLDNHLFFRFKDFVYHELLQKLKPVVSKR
jgi:hypothetical protein